MPTLCFHLSALIGGAPSVLPVAAYPACRGSRSPSRDAFTPSRTAVRITQYRTSNERMVPSALTASMNIPSCVIASMLSLFSKGGI